MSKALDPDQDRLSVYPDLGLNCLHIGYQQTKVAPPKERYKPKCDCMHRLLKFLMEFNPKCIDITMGPKGVVTLTQVSRSLGINDSVPVNRMFISYVV